MPTAARTWSSKIVQGEEEACVPRICDLKSVEVEEDAHVW